MMNKKINLFLILLSLIYIISCKNKIQISETQIQDLALESLQKKPNKIISNKKFDIYPNSALEHIALYQIENELFAHIITYNTDTSKFKTLRLISLGNYTFQKIVFLKTSLNYSHTLLITKPNLQETTNTGDNVFIKIFIFDYLNLLQEIPLNEADAKSVSIKKINPKTKEEGLIIRNEAYRFDSFIYAKTIAADKPLPFLDTFELNNENSMIIVKNKGGFSSQSYVTFSFPEIKPQEQAEIIRLLKDIPTVKMYKVGQLIYKKNTERMPAQHLVIEITKAPFSKDLPIKLPLFLNKDPNKIGKVLIRAAFPYRGINAHWPSDEQEESQFIEKDQQGYKAYVYKPIRK